MGLQSVYWEASWILHTVSWPESALSMSLQLFCWRVLSILLSLETSSSIPEK